MESETSEKQLAIELASEYNFGDNIGSIYKTWFTPPHTGKYRFYMICDDNCQMKIGLCAGSTSPLTTLLSLSGWTQYNAFWSNENRYSDAPKKVSDWVELEKDQHYYMYTKYMEGGGNDYMKSGVEIENSGIVGHHHTMKEI